MLQSTPSLGLTADELQRLVHSLMGPSAGAYDEIEAVPPLVYQARRAALEATAALIAANNRRLSAQLSRLGQGSAAAMPPSPPGPGPLWSPAYGAPHLVDGQAHD